MVRKIFFGTLFVLICNCAFAQVDVDAGKVTGEGIKINVPVYRVNVVSSDSLLQETARKMFNLHGSYILTDAAKAQFTFDFAKISENSVSISIKGASNFTQTCTAPTLVEALMKACDLAVVKTLRSQGFFAGKLAFSYSTSGASKTSEICVSDMPFKSVKKITNDKSDSLMPHLSPDGSKLTYTGYYRTNFMDLFLVDLNTNTRKVLASFKGGNTGGSFSPDGTKIAVILTASGNAEVFTMNVSGGGFKRVTKTSATESSPSFSPDGRQLIFASDNRGSPQIYIMPAGGGNMRMLVTKLSRYVAEPMWNRADPDKVLFTAAQGKGFQIGVYDLKTKSAKWVTSGASSSGGVWLNDGRHIVCTKSVGSQNRLYVVDTETLRQTPLHSTQFGSAKEPSAAYAPR